MKIYQYWCEKIITETVNGEEKKRRFRAGANESPEAAERAVKEKIGKYHAVLRAWADGQTVPEKKQEPEYAAPICEEWCDWLDEHNIVTRNRYGALVLNSEELLFLDVDKVPYTFKERVRKLFGLKVQRDRDRLLMRLESYLHLPEFQGMGIRVYMTQKGFRVLLSLPGLETLQSPRMTDLFRQFYTDPLYADLCRKQQCFRARLTPKPARIGMRTMLKFRFPYAPEDKEAITAYLDEYQQKSGEYAVCKLIAQLGKRFNSPAIEYHDSMTKCGSRLPLA